MPTIGQVQVLAAFQAKAFASVLANRQYRVFQQGVFPKKFPEIYLSILWNQQAGLGNVLFLERIKFGELPSDRLLKIGKALYAFKRSDSLKGRHNDQTLRGSTNIYITVYLAEVEVVIMVLVELKRKVTIKSHRGIDDESDIDSQAIL